MTKLDIRDWFVLICVTAVLVVSAVYLFKYPSKEAFATWAGVAATMTGAYYWLVLLDSKRPDAPRGKDDAGAS